MEDEEILKTIIVFFVKLIISVIIITTLSIILWSFKETKTQNLDHNKDVNTEIMNNE